MRSRPSDGVLSAPSRANRAKAPEVEVSPRPSEVARPLFLFTALRWGLFALFMIVGTAKVFAVPAAVALFDALGFGQWFRYLVGGCEVLGAILLTRASTALAGTAVLAFVMIGAAGTEVMMLHRAPVNSALTLAAIIVLALSMLLRT